MTRLVCSCVIDRETDMGKTESLHVVIGDKYAVRGLIV